MTEIPPLLSIIIPVYNEKSTITEVIEKVAAVDLPIRREIVVIDDGSNDGTAEVLRDVQGVVARIHFAPVNVGKGAAVRIGLTLVRGDIILIQDADLELDPNEYLSLITPILMGEAEIVYGSRFLGENEIPAVRRFANYVLTATTNLLFGTRLTDMETAYKAFTAGVAERITLRAKRFEVEPEITAQFAKLGVEIHEVPISYRPRTRDEGKKIKWQDGLRALTMLFRQRFARPPRRGARTRSRGGARPRKTR